MQYFSSEPLAIFDDLLMLPQRGAFTGGSGRPPNAYALLFDDHVVLFDAAFSWTLASANRLAAEGRPPSALVLSHRNIPGSADALDAFRKAFDLPVLLHPADQDHDEAKDKGPYADPEEDTTLKAEGLQVVHLPGHTAGSIMLHWPAHGGVMLAGDCAVGPGPRQADATPQLQRPKMGDEAVDRAFREKWQRIASEHEFRSVLPLHGDWYADRDDMFEILRGVWEGEPMDPSGKN